MPLKGRENVKAAMGDIKENLNDKVRAVYFAGLGQIIQQTPVDEGVTRNNWFLTLSAPSTRSTTAEGAGQNAQRQLSKMPSNVLGRKIYLTNNKPNILSLEYGGYPNPVKRGTYNKRLKKYEIRSINGYSKQAPNGWVRATILRMAKKIRS